MKTLNTTAIILAAWLLAGGAGTAEEDPTVPAALADTLHAFVSARTAQIEALARDNQIELAPAFRQILDQATAGQWTNVIATHESIWPRGPQASSAEETDPALANLLWEPINELVWACREFIQWPPELLKAYADEMLRLIGDADIYLGGTDPGRFAVGAFREARGKPDTCLLTQNAFSTTLYLDYVRALYGDRIWIPAASNVTETFEGYVNDVTRGTLAHQDQIQRSGAQVIVTGEEGQMEINSRLTRLFVKHNREQHAIVVEESFVMPWLNRQLEPHGLVLRLGQGRRRLTRAQIEADTAYWASLEKELLANPAFASCLPARRLYARLRATIAGVYATRGLLEMSEEAFLQALRIHPGSRDATFRIVREIFVPQRRFHDSYSIMERLVQQQVEPVSEKDEKPAISAMVGHIMKREKQDKRVQEIRETMADGTMDMKDALELCDIYAETGKIEELRHLAVNVLASRKFPYQVYHRLARSLRHTGSRDILIATLRKCEETMPKRPPPDISRDVSMMWASLGMVMDARRMLPHYLAGEPEDWRAWLDLAKMHRLVGDRVGTKHALRRAEQYGKQDARAAALKDAELRAIAQKLFADTEN